MMTKHHEHHGCDCESDEGGIETSPYCVCELHLKPISGTVSIIVLRTRKSANVSVCRSVHQHELIAHFRRLRRTFRTPMIILLDNLNQHIGADLRSWCAAVSDVHLEYLSPYSPELNPTEGVCPIRASVERMTMNDTPFLQPAGVAIGTGPRRVSSRKPGIANV